ncbi:hypothetical protein [Ruminococcus sp.]|uniref:hypothetical protein n=1 Tax=Ruminococcus sp. TaxID=41978 RepID=UPI0025FD264D|nr:hypothetical protein [Ruminococcus sp.]
MIPPKKIEPSYYDYIAAQKRVEQMTVVNEDIQNLDEMITDMQMCRRGNREGILTLQWFIMARRKNWNFGWMVIFLTIPHVEN